MFVKENAEDFMIDHMTWFLRGNEPTEGSSGHMHSSMFSQFVEKDFRSCKPSEPFFHQKGIYFQINRKKMKKKDTPTPRGRFTETQLLTHNVECLLMITCSFSSLLNCTSLCGSSSRSPQDLYCKSCRFLELAPHGEVKFNKDEKLQDAVLINMLMLDKYWKMQHWVLKLVRFVCFLH